MPRNSKRDQRAAALRRHHEAEQREFGLKPWECAPCMAIGEAPPSDRADVWSASWPRARDLRLRLLAANPHHYDDIG